MSSYDCRESEDDFGSTRRPHPSDLVPSSPPPPSPTDDRKGFVRAIVEAFRDAPYPSVDIAVDEIMATFRGDYPATPSSPETPEALHDWLVKLQKAVRNANDCTAETDPSYGELYEDQRREAVAAIETIYTRQREVAEKNLGALDAAIDERIELLDEIERLKAEQIELKREAILAFYNGASVTVRRHVKDSYAADGFVEEINKACESALRLQSGGTTDG